MVAKSLGVKDLLDFDFIGSGSSNRDLSDDALTDTLWSADRPKAALVHLLQLSKTITPASVWNIRVTI